MSNWTPPQRVSKDLSGYSPPVKKPEKFVDLMVSGPGIPWEDRGSVGFMGAFFGTAVGIMFKPVETLAKMRRPETSTDARIFAYAMGVVWFLAVAIQSAFAYFVFYNRDTSLAVDGQQYVLNTVLGGVLAGAAAAFGSWVVSWMFYRLTAFDMTSKAPPVLVANCITYLMGPSLLALIPGGIKPWLALGPVLAGIWMFIVLLIAAIGRLRIRVGAAIIGSFLTFIATAGMVSLGIFLVNFVWCSMMAKASLLPPFETTDVLQK